MAMRVRTSQSRGDPYHHPWLPPDAPGPMTSMCLAASWGVGTSPLQRPSIRAGANTRHPMLYASFDESRKAQRRRPHLDDGVLRRPGNAPGRLHQHPDRGVTPHQPSVDTSVSPAPAGITPVSRKRQSAMRNLRATATIPSRLKRFPPLPKRSRNQTRRALSGGKRRQRHANSVVIQRTCRWPALVLPWSRALSPL